jgi:hypothetical protein
MVGSRRFLDVQWSDLLRARAVPAELRQVRT